MSRSIEENKAVVRRVFDEAWNKRNLNIAEELWAPEYIHYDPSNPEPIRGPQGSRERLTTVQSAFPDIQFSIGDMIGEGDKVVIRFPLRGTQEGTFAGITPTGKKVVMTGILISRVRNGRKIEEWAERDTLSLMRQLGRTLSP